MLALAVARVYNMVDTFPWDGDAAVSDTDQGSEIQERLKVERRDTSIRTSN